MAGATRLEINFNRLLHRCETMAEDKTQKSWRLEKYIGALQDQLAQIKKAHSRPPPETLSEYHKKVELLKGLIEVDKISPGSEKVKAAERLQSVRSVPASASSRQLQARARIQSQEDMRTQLLGSPSASQDSEVRQRSPRGVSGGEEGSDIDQVLQHHHRMQERLAEEMLQHTLTLKQNITNAGRLVKDDVKTMGDTIKVAERNTDRLEKESARLEGYTQSCSWWMLIMLLVVIFTFLFMIFFMKLFPKG